MTDQLGTMVALIALTSGGIRLAADCELLNFSVDGQRSKMLSSISVVAVARSNNT
jgi:hypothetical protein